VQSAAVAAFEQRQPSEPWEASVKQQLYVLGQEVNEPPGSIVHTQPPLAVSFSQVQAPLPEPPAPPVPVLPPAPPVPVPISQSGIVWAQAAAAAQSDMFRHS
jgi:hypothetical protein